MSKTFGRKVEKKKLFSCRLFPSFFLIAFLAVSLHEEPKNTIKTFSKIRPENLKKSQKKVGSCCCCFCCSSSHWLVVVASAGASLSICIFVY
jgi:hypothetical protein